MSEFKIREESGAKFHQREVAALLRDRDAEIAKLQAHGKARDESFEVLRAENDRLRKAILTWWRGSPEDTDSEVQLRSVATELEDK